MANHNKQNLYSKSASTATPAAEETTQEITTAGNEQTKTESPVENTSGKLMNSTTSAVGSAPAPVGTASAALKSVLVDAVNAQMGLEGYSKDGQDLIKEVLTTGSPITKASIRELLDYCKEMAPGKMVPDDVGCSKQIGLYRMLQNAMNNGGADFQLMFATILRVVYELKDTGAFKITHAFRFFDKMTMSRDDREAFQALLQTMLTLCDPSNRKLALKQIDFNHKSLIKCFNVAGRQRFLQFFQN